MNAIISTYQFSVPNWEGVSLYDKHTHVMEAANPPNLDAISRDALRSYRLLYALAHIIGEKGKDGENAIHPYAITGPSHTYYAYEAEDGYLPILDTPGAPRVRKRYGFYTEPPDSFETHYEYSPDEAAFEIVVSEASGNYALRMATNETASLYLLNHGASTMHPIMIRATAIVHILAGLDGDWTADSLPWDIDTVEIARQRILHTLKWRFEDSLIDMSMKA